MAADTVIPGFAAYAGGGVPVAMLAALLITLIPTTIAALLSAIGIAGMERLVRFNVLAKSGRAVKAAGDIDVLLLDKTGTITIGDANRILMALDVGKSDENTTMPSTNDVCVKSLSGRTLKKRRTSSSCTCVGPISTGSVYGASVELHPEPHRLTGPVSSPASDSAGAT